MEEVGTPRALARALDRSDLDRLYRQYGALVFRRARKILADEQLARDVCQDVFVQLLRTGGSWEVPSRIGWLFRTTTNCCLNLIRGVSASEVPVAVSPNYQQVAIATPGGIYVKSLTP